MQTQSRVIVAMTVFNRDIMTNLPTDSVAVVLPGGDLTYLNVIDVLKEDTSRIVSVQFFVVGSIPIQRQILDDQVFDLFPGYQREQR